MGIFDFSASIYASDVSNCYLVISSSHSLSLFLSRFLFDRSQFKQRKARFKIVEKKILVRNHNSDKNENRM